MSEPSSSEPRIVIVKAGQKFPPLRYDAESTPDTSVTATTRRNGQVTYSRRIIKPTMVISIS
jgi:hypothetical protein